jgi:hypothetical protein
MYTYSTVTGQVKRNADNVVVSPVDNTEDPGYVEYMQWCIEGNTPDEVGENPLSLAQKAVWESIKVERDRKKHAGVKVGNYWFHSDPNSRTQQIALTIIGTNVPAGLMWKTLSPEGGLFEPVEVEMTPTLVQQIFLATMIHDNMFYRAAEVHRANMLILDDPYLYDYSVNWPLCFEDFVVTE